MHRSSHETEQPPRHHKEGRKEHRQAVIVRLCSHNAGPTPAGPRSSSIFSDRDPRVARNLLCRSPSSPGSDRLLAHSLPTRQMAPVSSRTLHRRADPTSVFLNVPFDDRYEPIFIALIAALTSIGRKPRCVLELPERGQGRLARILAHLLSCQVSIHDLSRVGPPPRFNMPFELGVAFAQRVYVQSANNHSIVLVESVPHRLSRTLSDMAGFDPVIHSNRPRRAISCILDSLGSGASDPSTDSVYRMWRQLMRASAQLKIAADRDDIYSRSLFRKLVAASTELSARSGFIRR